MMLIFLVTITTSLVCISLFTCCLAFWFRRRFFFSSDKTRTIAFLHPACAAGGGGEGVLWTAIEALQKSKYCSKGSHHFSKIVIYSDRNSSVSDPAEIVSRVQNQFGIDVYPEYIELVPLRFATWALRPESFPFLTLAVQAFFSMLLALEALFYHQPNVMIDTTGLTFCLSVFRFFLGKNCKIGAYVHYPWISTNMISVVASRTPSFNNRSTFARSRFLSAAKVYYYKLLASAYACAGSCAEVAMVNSMWTRDHVAEIWSSIPSDKLLVVYPPVNVAPFLDFTLDRKLNHNEMTAVFVAQFRPEKNHPFLLESFAAFLNWARNNDKGFDRYFLKLIGSCRSGDDEKRLNGLKEMAENLGIAHNVKFCVGLSRVDLIDALVSAQVAVHPMVDEHFGIAVVEAMAAGLVVIAHDSGGPARDILLPFDDNSKQAPGILVSRGCLDKEAFSGALRQAFIEMSNDDRFAMAKAARQVAEQRFSSKRFQKDFLSAVNNLTD